MNKERSSEVATERENTKMNPKQSWDLEDDVHLENDENKSSTSK